MLVTTFALGILVLLPALWLVGLAWRRAVDDITDYRDNAEIARIEDGFRSWNEPTPPQQMRAIAWPQRQTPTDLAPAYEPIPWTDPDWAVNELRAIVYANQAYEKMMVAA